MKFAIVAALAVMTVGSMSFAGTMGRVSCISKDGHSVVMSAIISDTNKSADILALPDQHLTLKNVGRAMDGGLAFMQEGSVLNFTNGRMNKILTVTNSQFKANLDSYESTALLTVETKDMAGKNIRDTQTLVRINCTSY